MNDGSAQQGDTALVTVSFHNFDQASLLALSRQAVPALRDDASENLSARGAYELLGALRHVVLLLRSH